MEQTNLFYCEDYCLHVSIVHYFYNANNLPAFKMWFDALLENVRKNGGTVSSHSIDENYFSFSFSLSALECTDGGWDGTVADIDFFSLVSDAIGKTVKAIHFDLSEYFYLNVTIETEEEFDENMQNDLMEKCGLDALAWLRDGVSDNSKAFTNAIDGLFGYERHSDPFKDYSDWLDLFWYQQENIYAVQLKYVESGVEKIVNTQVVLHDYSSWEEDNVVSAATFVGRKFDVNAFLQTYMGLTRQCAFKILDLTQMLEAGGLFYESVDANSEQWSLLIHKLNDYKFDERSFVCSNYWETDFLHIKLHAFDGNASANYGTSVCNSPADENYNRLQVLLENKF